MADTPLPVAAALRVAMLVWNGFRHDARVLNGALTLQRAGYAVTVHALRDREDAPRWETLPSGVQVRRATGALAQRSAGASFRLQPGAGGRPARMLRAAALVAGRAGVHARWLAALMRQRPAVIHAHDVNTLPTAWLAAALLRVPLVYDAHEISVGREGYESFRPLVAALERRLMPRARATLTTTDLRARCFRRLYGVERPTVLQNRPRRAVVAAGDRIRAALGLRDERPIVLYQGGLQRGRGLFLLLEAAATLPAAHLVLLGGGHLAPDLHAWVAARNLGDRIHFMDAVPLEQLPAYTASADIGVQPIENSCLNHYTTDSNKLFEYVHAGLPVVASELPEIRRVVAGHDLGLLVKPGDTKALTAALNTLIAEPERRKYHAGRAVQAAELLCWEADEHRLLSLYEKVIA